MLLMDWGCLEVMCVIVIVCFRIDLVFVAVMVVVLKGMIG